MLKECLFEIMNPKYGDDVCEGIRKVIEEFEEYQLQILLAQGLSISENYVVQKYPHGGFNCFNKDKMIKGNLPVCRIMENKMNKKLNDKLNETSQTYK